MTVRDCYIILGVSPNTTMEEVRRRYRALARQYHPDHHPDDPEAAAQFRQLAEAYETIQQYRSRARAASQNLHRPKFTGTDELYEDFFGISGGRTPWRQSAGADFRYDLQISFAAALRGTQTVIRVERTFNCQPCRGTGLAPKGGYATCPQCQGRGRRYGGPGLLRFGPVCHRCRGRGQIIAQPCDHCHGQGSTLGKREYRLRIPPGIVDGTRLRLDGEGGEGFRNGPPGNLEVVIHVASGRFFHSHRQRHPLPGEGLLRRCGSGRLPPGSYLGRLSDGATAPGHRERLGLPLTGRRRPRGPRPAARRSGDGDRGHHCQ